MFETLKAFHEALRTESTWPFVLMVALAAAVVFGVGAWAVDVGYKRKMAAESESVYPIVDFDFTSQVTLSTLFLTIADRGDFPLRNVRMEATEYALKQRQTITVMSRFGGSALLTEQIASRIGESKPFDLGKSMPLRFESSHENRERPSVVPTDERFYALRFTFLHGSKKRFCFYKVVSAMPPYLLLDEST